MHRLRRKHGTRKTSRIALKKEINNVEIKIEKLCQHDYVVRAVVVCITMDEEEEIGTKMIKKHDENDLRMKHVSLKWTSATFIKNSIRIFFYDKLD